MKDEVGGKRVDKNMDNERHAVSDDENLVIKNVKQ